MITRRQWMQAGSAFAAALAIGGRGAAAQGARALRVGFGQKAISANLINLLIGEVLGYNAAELEERLAAMGLAEVPPPPAPEPAPVVA